MPTCSCRSTFSKRPFEISDNPSLNSWVRSHKLHTTESKVFLWKLEQSELWALLALRPEIWRGQTAWWLVVFNFMTESLQREVIQAYVRLGCRQSSSPQAHCFRVQLLWIFAPAVLPLTTRKHYFFPARALKTQAEDGHANLLLQSSTIPPDKGRMDAAWEPGTLRKPNILTPLIRRYLLRACVMGWWGEAPMGSPPRKAALYRG